MNVENLTLSDLIPTNNGKDTRYVIGYLTQYKQSSIIIKTPKNIYSHGASRYSEGSASTVVSFDLGGG